MGWLLLTVAIFLEVSGTTCMKLSDGFKEVLPSVLVFIFYGLSFTAFIFALKTLDLSIAYAMWAAIGLSLIAAIGIVHFNEPVTALKMLAIALIVIGVIGLSYSEVTS